MGNISVRKVPKDVVYKIDEMAAQKKMSREEFLRNHFKEMTVDGAVRNIENKYEVLVNLLTDRLEENNMIMEQTTQLMERLTEYMEMEKSDE